MSKLALYDYECSSSSHILLGVGVVSRDFPRKLLKACFLLISCVTFMAVIENPIYLRSDMNCCLVNGLFIPIEVVCLFFRMFTAL